jgi:hypothetical protein
MRAIDYAYQPLRLKDPPMSNRCEADFLIDATGPRVGQIADGSQHTRPLHFSPLHLEIRILPSSAEKILDVDLRCFPPTRDPGIRRVLPCIVPEMAVLSPEQRHVEVQVRLDFIFSAVGEVLFSFATLSKAKLSPQR